MFNMQLLPDVLMRYAGWTYSLHFPHHVFFIIVLSLRSPPFFWPSLTFFCSNSSPALGLLVRSNSALMHLSVTQNEVEM